ncbi:MAG TPA: class I SAM-dependent methyltransferase [Terriglobia bacterium]|nr:class I SAM-dependent methyltransferase [Terriglobia bacterium]
MSFLSRLTHPPRLESSELETPEEIDAFIDSRALEYPTKIEDDFVQRALALGVEGGMILDVGTHVGLIPLKILWQNENFYAIGMDKSGVMIERARETAAAWGLGDRTFFQVGDARKMRLKTAYFDLVVSDLSLHVFDDPLSVLTEINRVLKPKGALLIRDFERPSRFDMRRQIAGHSERYGNRMRRYIETAMRAAFTRIEIGNLVQGSGLERVRISAAGDYYVMIERTGESDPNSWIKAREQYL